MLKYEPISDGNGIGASLKPGEEGVILEVAIRGSGELGACEQLTYKDLSKGCMYMFPLDSHVRAVSPHKLFLSQLSEGELEQMLNGKIAFLPEDELRQIYDVLNKGIPIN